MCTVHAFPARDSAPTLIRPVLQSIFGLTREVVSQQRGQGL